MRRVAVLGGGCGGLAAAWTLTAPELRGRFDVTVYQSGHRLGGKGASGRAPHDADGRGARIEEHGLHIWFGFYDHAFRMLRDAYDESGLSSGPDWWQLPFQKCNEVTLYQRRPDGTWIPQPLALPGRGGATAGPPTAGRRPPLSRVLAATTRMIAVGLRGELRGNGPVRRGPGDAPDDPQMAALTAGLDALAGELDALDSDVTLGDGAAAGDATRRIGMTSVREQISDAGVRIVLDRLRAETGAIEGSAAGSGRGGASWAERLSLWRDVLELVAASVTGILRDGLLRDGLSAIDELDLREWLARGGADPAVLERSPVLRGLYDLTFSYHGGDKRSPSLAAGKGLQALLMMINYEGAFMWRMRAGMGDVVFSPLYLALRRRGVRFEFFSHITALRLDPERRFIAAIELEREALLAGGVAGYEAVRRIGDWWCWPSEPYDDQIASWERRHETLTRFDDVVLAIPVGAQAELCAELIDASPRYRQMVEGASTVRTKALQLWLTKPIDELRRSAGGPGGSLDPPATAYAEPFDTYCDMTHLLAAEGASADGPRGVAYFCAVLPDEIAEDDALDAVRTMARQYLENEAATFWPGAAGPDGFNWDVLFDPRDRTGPARLEAQYLRANTSGTERYVTTTAGSVGSRLEPGDSGFENLVLAGDWTHNEIDGGCVEAAVISGERAAEALIASHR